MRTYRRLGDEDQALDRAHPRQTPRVEDAPRSPATIVELQERAGNRSVGALIAGLGPESLRGAVQRDALAAGGREAEAGQGGSSAATATIPKLDLVVPVSSFSQKASRGRARTK